MEMWWDSLPTFDKVLWGIAVFSSVTFIIQTILTFICVGHHETDFGVDSDISMDHDFDHGDVTGDLDADGGSFFVGYFTIRNFIAFLLGFSWGSLVFVDHGLSKTLIVVFGVVIGLIFVVAVMTIMKGLSKLKSTGTVSLADAVGREGTVSIMVPAKMEGQGKVNVSLQGRFMDLVAITRENETLKRGQQVKVVAVSNNQLIIEKII